MACIRLWRSVLDVNECILVPLMDLRNLQKTRHDLFSVEDGVTCVCACVQALLFVELGVGVLPLSPA
jgi:hypothetical protein